MSNNDAQSQTPRFVKPNKRKGIENKSTRHLYVSGLGHALNSTAEEVCAIFANYGELDHTGNSWGAVDLVEGKRFCFVSFVEVSSAEGAFTALKDAKTDVTGGIRIWRTRA